MKSNALLSSDQNARLALLFLLVCLLMARSACGQARQDQLNELDSALAKVKAGQANGGDALTIANAGAVQAIPALEELFRHETHLDTRLNIATGLVKLRDQDNTYWNFLLEQATLAVDSDVPDVVFDAQGYPRPSPATQDLEAWAQAHHVDVNTALRQAQNELPITVLRLGVAGDPRGIPLLRRALKSPHSMIVIMAAKSLAEMQDKESIPLIIEACQRSAVLAGSIAEASLVFFDDPQAQGAVDAFVPPERAKIWREARAQGMKPLGK